jgi:hypothetical protein
MFIDYFTKELGDLNNSISLLLLGPEGLEIGTAEAAVQANKWLD